MRDYLLDLVRGAPTPAHGRAIGREYLQARILGALQRAGAMIPLVFHGDMALRFLYGIPRYSEDLDFALERSGAGYDLRAYLQTVRADLSREGYALELKVSDRTVVHSAFVCFDGLLYELGLSPHRDARLVIKLEVDISPPAGAGLTTSVVRRYVTLQLQHHDRASLLAGKLHALLQSRTARGRDLFDLIWYLSDPGWPRPNLTLLNHALQQTGWAGPSITPDNWRALVCARVTDLPWDAVLADALPVLESVTDSEPLTRANVLRVLEDDRRPKGGEEVAQVLERWSPARPRSSPRHVPRIP
jgi:hypothetical protein